MFVFFLICHRLSIKGKEHPEYQQFLIPAQTPFSCVGHLGFSFLTLIVTSLFLFSALGAFFDKEVRIPMGYTENP